MPLRLPRFLPAFLVTVALAGCADSPPPVVNVPPPPPAATLSPRLVEMAGAYRHYMARATAIAPAFTDGNNVARALEAGAAYEPKQLVRGAMAYAAVVALQDRVFVENVRVYAKDPAQRRQVAGEILRDPAYVIGVPGSAGAAGLVIAALGGQGQGLYDGGKAVKQAAYDIQKQPWSKQDVAAREARLANAKSLSAAAMLGDVAETTRLQQAAAGAAPLGLAGAATAPPYTPTVVRGLAIAALAVLGEAGDANVETVLGLMSEPNVGMCMNMSKLNLYQCLAVARPHYEDVFCLGQHALMDTGRCVIRAAGLPEPYEARFVPDASSVNKGMGPRKAAPRKDRKKG